MKLRPQAETLSGSPQPNFTGYATSPVVATRAPTVSDTGYPFGQLWINKSSNISYLLTSVSGGQATWGATNGGSSNVNTINSLSPSAGDIEIAGTANQISIANAGHTVTLSLPSALIAPNSLQASSLHITGNAVVDGSLTAASLVFGALTVTSLTVSGGGAAITGGTDSDTLIVTGNTVLGSATGATTAIGNTNGSTGVTISVGTGEFVLTGATNSTIALGSGVSSGNISVGSGLVGGSILLGNASMSGAINLTTASTGTVGIGTNAASVSIMSQNGAVGTVNISSGTGTKTVHIADGAAANVVSIGSVTGAASLSLSAGTGNYTLTGSANTTITEGVGLVGGAITLGNAAMTGLISVGLSTAGQIVGINNAASIASTSSVSILSGTTNSAALTCNILNGAAPGSNTILNIMCGAGSAGAQTMNVLASGATRAGAINLGTGIAAHVVTIGQVTSSLVVNCPQTITIASGSATGLAIDVSAGTGVGATIKSTSATTDALQVVNGGLKVPVVVPSSGATPLTANGRFGQCTFTTVSIAAGATSTFVINNSLVTASTQNCLVTMYGATTAAAPCIQSVTLFAGSTATITIVVENGAAVTTQSGNLTFVFWLMD